jgi:hypothetical protein
LPQSPLLQLSVKMLEGSSFCCQCICSLWECQMTSWLELLSTGWSVSHLHPTWVTPLNFRSMPPVSARPLHMGWDGWGPFNSAPPNVTSLIPLNLLPGTVSFTSVRGTTAHCHLSWKLGCFLSSSALIPNSTNLAFPPFKCVLTLSFQLNFRILT